MEEEEDHSKTKRKRSIQRNRLSENNRKYELYNPSQTFRAHPVDKAKMRRLHGLNVLFATAAIGTVTILCDTEAFVVPSVRRLGTPTSLITTTPNLIRSPFIIKTIARSTKTPLFSIKQTLSLQLEKPLGLILEEDEETGSGVIVTQVNQGGSAYESPQASKLIGSKIQSVMGQDVSSLTFDDVMSVIVEAPSPLDVVFMLNGSELEEATTSSEDPAEEEPRYKIGTDVLITVQQPENNKPDIVLTAKVGDNLRKALLSNKDIELYRSLKKKLGNCGGGGQCGFCAVELIDEEGCWGERSDYEEAKIGKKESERCRLACLNTIAGPATVRTL
ncbi:hypothetical protein HJC23_009085 [Cyclotella cryptica]|uniref:PDZ domain-containing protein n=1 Tax=Cyclotella cryptica TaxID=29204 RepID=A0ABD3QYV3_9STRA